jgi:hypothetical protein
MRQAILVCCCLLLAVVLLQPSTAHANTEVAYSIPLLGRWANHTIGVTVPPAPTWLHDMVLSAMENWTTAQEWFAANFYPNGRIYWLQETSQNSNVTVGLNATMSAPGETDYWKTTTGQIVVAQIQLNIVIFTQPVPPPFADCVILHEFGHALGLDHVVDPPGDLMNPVLGSTCSISTLDLYAVHFLAGYNDTSILPTSVTMLTSLPYEHAYLVPLPEFSTLPALFVMVIVIGVVGSKQTLKQEDHKSTR